MADQPDILIVGRGINARAAFGPVGAGAPIRGGGAARANAIPRRHIGAATYPGPALGGGSGHLVAQGLG